MENIKQKKENMKKFQKDLQKEQKQVNNFVCEKLEPN